LKKQGFFKKNSQLMKKYDKELKYSDKNLKN
jgi:hypothetical protein